MNILNQLTIKHLKMNKKRTLVTIIGIILSTALMVGIGLLISTLLVSERMNAINSFGSHHAIAHNLSPSEISVLNKNVNVKKFNYYAPVGFALGDSEYLSKPYLYINEGSKEFLSGLTLVEGRLPKNDHELLVSLEMMDFTSLKYKLNQEITLDIGSRISEGEELDIAHNYQIPTSWENNQLNYQKEELNIKETKTYKIVGFITNNVYQRSTGAGFMVFSLNQKARDRYTALLEFKNPKETFQIIEDLKSSFEDLEISANENLLYYYGATKYSNVNETILPLMLIALSVISVGCIIVIYNSFAISTMERKKSFGLYASIGASMKQIKKTVLFEALIVGVIGIVIGVLSGFLGIYVVIKIINHLIQGSINLELVFSVIPLYIIVPLLFMVVVIFVSAYLPAKRSSKVSPIEAIRGNSDIKIKKKEVKSFKAIRRIFGIEGDIAYKNIKRNKKKYRITIVSLFISIVMFNTFTSFLGYIVKANDSVDYFDYDLSVEFYRAKESEIKKDIDTLKQKYQFDKTNLVVDQRMFDSINLDNDMFSKEFRDIYKMMQSDLNYQFVVVVLDDQDYNKITNKEALLLNQKYVTFYQNDSRVTKDILVFNKKNNKIKLKREENEVLIEAQVYDKEIFGLKKEKYSIFPTLVMSASKYQEYFALDKDNLDVSYRIKAKDYKRIYEELNKDSNGLIVKHNITSPAIENANIKNLVLAIKILFYGFIALITLIGVTSVINTVNTNINLRKKEFAMLRSVGLTPKGFNKLLFFESLFFGLKALIYGIPVSIGINALIALSMNNIIETKVLLPLNSFIISVVGVFVIVLLTMNYASKKIKKENILEALREENI